MAMSTLPAEGPDGGYRAWLVVFGSWCCNVIISGWLNALGVFQDYYSTVLFPGLPESTVAIIPSLVDFMIFAGGPIFGLIYDRYGPRLLLCVGGCLHVIGILAASVGSQHFYALVLSQGLCSALGASMMLYPAISSISTYFTKRRALALGITSTGGSIGGIIFPLMFESLVPVIGFGWTMRACALFIFILAVVANLTVSSRVPPTPRRFHVKEYIEPFQSNSYRLLSLSMLMYLGLFLPLTYIILQARQEGMSEYLAGKLVVVINAASLIGRLLPAWAADHIGRFNTAIIFSLLSTTMVLAFWVPLKNNESGIITFSVLYGIFSGAVIALTPALVSQISHVHEIGVRTGMLYGVIGLITLTSTLSAGAIVDDLNGQFIGLKIFCGVSIGLGALFLIWTRVFMTGWRLKARV
ncbi:putative monocarboxylate permease [Cryphonectria parasitica EP155]|uniref:Monocarboxylate permease n=1 Tax=Cryphonectria parasitica (strain ATCC 38755 / EP155) TaxID=660469 RepID=A0A9P4Y0Z1_CRYP1|nr:putative monocarboxylate permease [Cryphonectria parasitica EP155]KAF3764668.1 putative monocarboxylate permease [Cryphonectria parasitica EP155]